MGPVFVARVEFFVVISPLHFTEPRWVEKWPLGEKISLFFLNFQLFVKQFIFRSFLTIFGFLTAPFCIHKPFLGLDHFHYSQLCKPVKKIGLICQNNQFFWIFKHFCQFWSYLVIILTFTRPVFVLRVEFLAVISPLHSTEPIWGQKWPLGEKNFIIFHYFLIMCKTVHF